MKITLPQRSGSLLELVVRGSGSIMASTVIACAQTNTMLLRAIFLTEDLLSYRIHLNCCHIFRTTMTDSLLDGIDDLASQFTQAQTAQPAAPTEATADAPTVHETLGDAMKRIAAMREAKLAEAKAAAEASTAAGDTAVSATPGAAETPEGGGTRRKRSRWGAVESAGTPFLVFGCTHFSSFGRMFPVSVACEYIRGVVC